MSRDIVGFLSRVQRDYGDVASFRLGRRRIYLLSHPEHIRDVLVTRAENFTKGPALRMAKVTLGEGLLTSEGDFHRRQRRMIQPAFHAQRVADYGADIVRFALRARERWRPGEVVEVRAAMTQLTLEIVAKTLFDAEIDAEVRELGEAMDVTVTMFDRSRYPWAPLLNVLPLASNRRFLRAKDRVFQTIERMIADRRASPSERNDLLSILLRARDAEGDGGGMSDEQLRFEAMTLFTAGHETTANAMVWTWWLLAQNPAAEARLHEELTRELAGRAPTVADVPRLAYTRAVLSESMRLYPPAWIVGREAAGAHVVGDYEIPRGGVVLMSQYLVHRDARWWERPEAFEPGRWLGESSAAGRPRYAYFPFGGGPRQCVGESFAWLEGILLIATLAQRWRLRLVDGSSVRLHATITLRPRDPMRMRVEAR